MLRKKKRKRKKRKRRKRRKKMKKKWKIGAQAFQELACVLNTYAAL
jgi:hypothetical protein